MGSYIFRIFLTVWKCIWVSINLSSRIFFRLFIILPLFWLIFVLIDLTALILTSPILVCSLMFFWLLLFWNFLKKTLKLSDTISLMLKYILYIYIINTNSTLTSLNVSIISYAPIAYESKSFAWVVLFLMIIWYFWLANLCLLALWLRGLFRFSCPQITLTRNGSLIV